MSVFERETVAPMPDVLDPRVVRGAELLDEKLPGWAEQINLGEFDLSNCLLCVLGQTYGSYWDGLKVLELPVKGGHEYGFNTFDQEDSYAPLQQDWRLAILSRRSA